MRQKTEVTKPSAEKVIKDIRRITRKQYGAEEKIRIVLDGLRGEESIAALCRREGIAESLYYNWSKEFLEAGKKRLAGDTARAATTDEVKVLRKEARDLKEVVAEQALDVLGGGDRVFDGVVQDRGDDRLVVEMEVGQDAGHFDRVAEIGVARGALLGAVRVDREDICPVEHRFVGLRIVA